MEFVKLEADEEERLRQEVVGEIEPNPFYLPIHINHHSTFDFNFNFTPYTHILHPANSPNIIQVEIQGCIFLMTKVIGKTSVPFSSWNNIVGNSHTLHFRSGPFEKSWTAENFEATIREYHEYQSASSGNKKRFEDN